MDKTKLQANLFLYYLKFKKPLLVLTGMVAVVIIGLNSWLELEGKTINSDPWVVNHVEKNVVLQLTRNEKTIKAGLCGVKPIDTSTKEYLTSVIGLGDGTVELQKIGDRYEVWTYLKPGYDVELVKHLSPIPNELAGHQIHLNSWLIERGYASHEVRDRCTDSEILALAEKIAKEERFGAWGK